MKKLPGVQPKQLRISEEKQMVTAVPEIVHHSRHPDDEFVVEPYPKLKVQLWCCLDMIQISGGHTAYGLDL